MPIRLTAAQASQLSERRPKVATAAKLNARVKSKGALEASVTKECTDWLRGLDYEPIRQHAGLARGWSGGKPFSIGKKNRPDYYYAHPGKIGFFVEYKRERGGELSDGQITEHFNLRARGFKVCVPNTLEALQEWYAAEIEHKAEFAIAKKK